MKPDITRPSKQATTKSRLASTRAYAPSSVIIRRDHPNAVRSPQSAAVMPAPNSGGEPTGSHPGVATADPATQAIAGHIPDHERFAPPESAEKTGRSLWQRIQLPLIIILGIVAGVAVQSAPVGQMLIGAYGIVALIAKIESRTSFAVALLALATTVLMAVIHHNSVLAGTFAGYAFLLLLVGVVCSIRELREEKSLGLRRGNNRKY